MNQRKIGLIESRPYCQSVWQNEKLIYTKRISGERSRLSERKRFGLSVGQVTDPFGNVKKDVDKFSLSRFLRSSTGTVSNSQVALSLATANKRVSLSSHNNDYRFNGFSAMNRLTLKWFQWKKQKIVFLEAALALCLCDSIGDETSERERRVQGGLKTFLPFFSFFMRKEINYRVARIITSSLGVDFFVRRAPTC